MVLHATFGSAPVVVSLKAHSLALSIDETTVVAWDRGGRLYSFWRDGVTSRRGLSGHVLEKRHEDGRRIRLILPDHRADALLNEAAGIARRTSEAIWSADWRWDGPIDAVTAQEARTLLELCGRFDAGAARRDASAFSAVYRPIGILPPDQYLSLVLQATEGCSFNTCTFCDLYHEHYRVKTPEEFRSHVSAVRSYLGESLSLRSRGIFLGAANALAVPMARLLPIFEVLVEEADSIPRGVSAFVDGFTGRIKDTGDYRLLGDMGLRRVYVGLESGHDPLLQFVRKPGSAASAIEAVLAIKEAGLPVGVIVMTGLGGMRFADGHVTDTVTALSRMKLDAGDLVYISELVEIARTAYPHLAADAAIQPLDADAIAAQREIIRAAVGRGVSAPKVATYDVREFIY